MKKQRKNNSYKKRIKAEKLDLSANHIKDKLYKGSQDLSFSEMAKTFLDKLESNKKISQLLYR